MASRSRVYHYVFIIIIISARVRVVVAKGWLNPRLIIALESLPALPDNVHTKCPMGRDYYAGLTKDFSTEKNHKNLGLFQFPSSFSKAAGYRRSSDPLLFKIRVVRILRFQILNFIFDQ